MSSKSMVERCLDFFCIFSKNVIFFILAMLISILSISSLICVAYFSVLYKETVDYKLNHPLTLILILILFIMICVLIEKSYGLQKISTKLLLKILMIYMLIISTSCVLITKSYPVFDQKYVSDAATQFCFNDFTSLKPGNYIYVYPLQLGLAAVLEFIYHIFGPDSYLTFQIINCYALCILFYFLYKIVDIKFKSTAINNMFLLLSFGCFPPIVYCSFVYGEITSLAASLIAIYMQLKYFEYRKVSSLIISFLSITLAIIIRSNSIIILVAMVIMFILKAAETRKFSMIAIAVALILFNTASSYMLKTFYEHRSGIEINDGIPKIAWVAMGLQESEKAPGWYNSFSYDPYIENNYDAEKVKDLSKDSIKNSLSKFKNDPIYAVKFFGKKFLSQWNEPSYESFFMTYCAHKEQQSRIADSLYYGKLNHIALIIMNIYHFIIIIGSSGFILKYFKKIKIEELILALIVIGGFIFHMIWEAKGRYILPYFIMLIPYAACGIYWFIKMTEKKLKNKKNII